MTACLVLLVDFEDYVCAIRLDRVNPPSVLTMMPYLDNFLYNQTEAGISSPTIELEVLCSE